MGTSIQIEKVKTKKDMSGAQGTQPPGAATATTYESVQEENRPKTDLSSREDERGIQIDKL